MVPGSWPRSAEALSWPLELMHGIETTLMAAEDKVFSPMPSPVPSPRRMRPTSQVPRDLCAPCDADPFGTGPVTAQKRGVAG